MIDLEGILYIFDDFKVFCYDCYIYILKNVFLLFIFELLKIKFEIKFFFEGVVFYLNVDKICKELFEFKCKEFYYLLVYYYIDYELFFVVYSLF